MFYYKITETIVNEEIAEKLSDRHNGYEERSKCFMASDELFDKSDRKSFVFISGVSHRIITMGASKLCVNWNDKNIVLITG